MSDQMKLMADGLAGHQKDFYHYVNDSSWLGGFSEYSNLNEGFPYWFNGIVPLAYGLNDTRLKGQVYDALEYVLDHQQADGWLGPETTNSTRDLWARFPLILGFTQILEADQSQEERLIPALYRFINLMHSMLSANLGFIDYWGQVRYQDMIISLQWLYENAPGNNTQLLFDTMTFLQQRGRDWADYYDESSYLFNDLDTVEPEIGTGSYAYPWVHGVNAAQSLKAGAVIYRYTQNQTQLQSARNAVNWTLTYHGDVAGSIIGDEREVGLSPSRGSELCTAVELMYSLSYMYQLLGDRSFADRCELAAFNVLPAMLTSDQWARQYLTLANQPISYSLEEPVPFFNAGPDGILYGTGRFTAISSGSLTDDITEPNYPCCTVNHHQGLPKFLSASFVRVGNSGLGHALLLPAKLNTMTNNGIQVNVTCETKYPFGDTLNYSINTSGVFDFHVRVPDWYDPASSTIAVNGEPASISPDSHTGMTAVSIPQGTANVSFVLKAPSIRVVSRENSSVAIYHGTLLYALDVGQSIVTLAPDFTSNVFPYSLPSLILNMMDKRLPPPPAQAHDYNITNTKPWNIAIDTSTLQFHAGSDNGSSLEGLPSPLWTPGGPPTYITAQGCQIEWPLFRGLPAAVPLPVNGTRTCTSPALNITLRPYGSLKIHMAELPTVNLTLQGVP